jgi:hypothetical protein
VKEMLVFFLEVYISEFTWKAEANNGKSVRMADRQVNTGNEFSHYKSTTLSLF